MTKYTTTLVVETTAPLAPEEQQAVTEYLDTQLDLLLDGVRGLWVAGDFGGGDVEAALLRALHGKNASWGLEGELREHD